jgi:hypothetical protein
MLTCDEQDFYFCAAADGTTTGTLVTAAPQAASLTALVAKRMRAGWSRSVFIRNTMSVLIVKTAASTGTLRITPIGDVGEDIEINGHPTSGQAATGTTVVSGAVTATTTKATPASTSNATYLVNQSMAADVDGGAITVGPEGTLEVSAKWTAASTQIGILVLQSLSGIDGTTYILIPGTSGGFESHPNNDTKEVKGYFWGLRPGASVRVKYIRTSGGAAGNNLNVSYTAQ